MADSVSVIPQPGSACFFQSGVEHMPVAGFNRTGTDGQPQSVGLGIVQTIDAVAQISMAATYGCLFIGHIHWFQTLSQGFDDLMRSPSAQSLLLSAAPPVRVAGPADGRGGSEIFAHVKEIAQKVSLLSKDFLGLESNPFGSIGDHVNAAI